MLQETTWANSHQTATGKTPLCWDTRQTPNLRGSTFSGWQWSCKNTGQWGKDSARRRREEEARYTPFTSSQIEVSAQGFRRCPRPRAWHLSRYPSNEAPARHLGQQSAFTEGTTTSRIALDLLSRVPKADVPGGFIGRAGKSLAYFTLINSSPKKIRKIAHKRSDRLPVSRPWYYSWTSEALWARTGKGNDNRCVRTTQPDARFDQLFCHFKHPCDPVLTRPQPLSCHWAGFQDRLFGD